MTSFSAILALLIISTATASSATNSQFIDVGDGVKVEVLDWGGVGRPVVLLPGSGNTAHVFEDFAPKLIQCCHVHAYGITRRGFGLSSKPRRGYATPDLAEDDFLVIQALRLQKPIIMGHSVAGSEMTFLGQKLPAELGALVYLDANADPLDYPWDNPEYRTLVMKAANSAPSSPKRTPADNASVAAYQAYQRRRGEAPFPAEEIRNMYELNADGSIGSDRNPPYVSDEIGIGSIAKDYRGMHVPALALIAVPFPPAEKWGKKPAQKRRGAARLRQIRRDPDGIHSPLGDQPEKRGFARYGCRTSRCSSLHFLERRRPSPAGNQILPTKAPHCQLMPSYCSRNAPFGSTCAARNAGI